jgi:hypothetical protein
VSDPDFLTVEDVLLLSARFPKGSILREDRLPVPAEALCAIIGDRGQARAIFRRMLWLNPSDSRGARFNLAALEAGKTWEEMEGADA